MVFPSRVGFAVMAMGWLAAPIMAALPAEITVTAPAKLELMRGDKVSGSIGLPAGEKLTLVDVAGDFALVRYRKLDGRVALAQTDLAKPEAPAAAAGAPSAPTQAAAVPTQPAKATPRHVPANALERWLAGKLVRLEGGALRPVEGARLAGVKYYALYFSASWCGPCREFTPGFVDAYAKIRAQYPEFEVVLVNRDRSAPEMLAYMQHERMAWPAVRWDLIEIAPEINHYAGEGIPCLVLVDEKGKVLSNSYRWGRYVGPGAVLDDTWKILRDYRRKNPREKS